MSQPATHRERAAGHLAGPRNSPAHLAIGFWERAFNSALQSILSGGQGAPMIVANAGIKTQDAAAPIGRAAHRLRSAVLRRNRGYMACPRRKSCASRTLTR